MSKALTGRRDSGTVDGKNGNAAAIGAADFLYLAAAPTFAIMALLTGVLGGGSPDTLCSIVSTSPLSGMVPMYWLMSAFHSAPWLKLISLGRRDENQAKSAASPHPNDRWESDGTRALYHRNGHGRRRPRQGFDQGGEARGLGCHPP
jgi:hypothetical protein